MNNISVTDTFKRELKRLCKRYPSLVDDFESFLNEIETNPYVGVDLGNGVRKIRMAIKSKGKGKSGGARIITFNVILSENTTSINLVYIYDKSERSSIQKDEIIELLKKNQLI